MTNSQIRSQILADRDVERVTIKRNGEVHVYGVMPNTNQTGWYLAGYRDEMVRGFEYKAGVVSATYH